MFLKKTVLIGTLAIFGLPLTTQALVTTNNTQQPSTVHITTGQLKWCSNRVPGGITAAGDPHHFVPQEAINILCKGSAGGKCGADIYMSNNCTGDIVEKATLNMSTGEVTLSGMQHPRYDLSVDPSDKSHLTMNYRK